MKLYINEQKKTDVMPIFMGGIVFLIFFIYNCAPSNTIFFLGIISFLFCLMILSFDQLFLVCVLLIPNINTIKFIDSDTAILGYFMLLVELKYILFKKFVFSPWIFIHTVSLLITVILYSEISLLISYIRNFAFFIYICSIFKNEELFQSLKYQKEIIVYYLLGLSLNVVFGLMFWIINGWDLLNGFFSGIRNGRNYFSSLVGHGMGLLLLFFFENKRKRSLCLFCFCVLLLCGGLAGSRTFLISLIFILLEFLLLTVDRKHIGLGLIFSIIFFAIIIIFWDSIYPIFQRIIDRFTNETAEDGNGRFGLWQYYLQLTFSSGQRFLFGNGSSLKYVDLGLVDAVEHNTLIQAISTVGVCGTITWIITFILLYEIIVSKKRKSKFLLWLPLLSGLCFYMSINAFYGNQFNMLMVVSFVAINVFASD